MKTNFCVCKSDDREGWPVGELLSMGYNNPKGLSGLAEYGFYGVDEDGDIYFSLQPFGDVITCEDFNEMLLQFVKPEESFRWLKLDFNNLPEDKKMFVVKAINVLPHEDSLNVYTSDEYCVWLQNGEFKRWPHSFKPTHYLMLPEEYEG